MLFIFPTINSVQHALLPVHHDLSIDGIHGWKPMAASIYYLQINCFHSPIFAVSCLDLNVEQYFILNPALKSFEDKKCLSIEIRQTMHQAACTLQDLLPLRFKEHSRNWPWLVAGSVIQGLALRASLRGTLSETNNFGLKGDQTRDLQVASTML